jgi:hypothetical protein
MAHNIRVNNTNLVIIDDQIKLIHFKMIEYFVEYWLLIQNNN